MNPSMHQTNCPMVAIPTNPNLIPPPQDAAPKCTHTILYTPSVHNTMHHRHAPSKTSFVYPPPQMVYCVLRSCSLTLPWLTNILSLWDGWVHTFGNHTCSIESEPGGWNDEGLPRPGWLVPWLPRECSVCCRRNLLEWRHRQSLALW